MTTTTTFLDHALRYAAQGFYVHPLKTNSNKPATPHGQRDATTDDARIREWWKDDSRRNIGVFLKPSGLCVIDIDRHGGDGFATLAALEAEHGPLPPTLTATTPRGGEHRFYRVPYGVDGLPGHLGPEVDLKWNGYVVLPPSRRDEEIATTTEGHTSRKHIAGDYVFIDETVEIADLPDWVVGLSAEKEDAAYLTFDGAGKRTDGRKRFLWRLIGKLLHAGVPQDTVIEMVKLDNAMNNTVMLDERYIEEQVIEYKLTHPPEQFPGAAWSLSKNGARLPNLNNAVTALTFSPNWYGVLGWNEFTQKPEARLGAPWGFKGVWDDAQDSSTAVWLQDRAFVQVPTALAAEAVMVVARKNTFHPVRDYLNGLVWDGKSRIGSWLKDYLHAECRDEIHEKAVGAMGAKWLISAVARVFRPGCKADHILVLEGEQGIGKSTTGSVLFEPWFTDNIADLGTKDSRLSVLGVWCIEIAELVAASRRDVADVKEFITCRVDRFRPPYGRHLIEHPRQCVLLATTNEIGYLRDQTGNRRFWPVKLTAKIDAAGLLRDKDQLWAEAAELYRRGAQWHFEADETELLDVIMCEQQERTLDDAWAEPLANYVKDYDRVSLAHLLGALSISVKDADKLKYTRITNVMTHDLKWHKQRTRRFGGQQQWFFRHADHSGEREPQDGLSF